MRLSLIGALMPSNKRKPAPGAKAAAALAPSRGQIAAAILAVLIVYIALRLPGIGVPLDRDEGAFGYMGQLIRSGGVPYCDGLDHKPPVAFLINALMLSFVPPTEAGDHLFLLLYNLLTLVCVFYLGKTCFDSLSVGLWCALSYAVFSASPAIQGFTASTEMWMLLPISASLLLAVVGVRKGRLGHLLASGAAGAIACWTKQTAVTSVLFVFLYVGIRSFRQGHAPAARVSVPVKALAAWLAGFVVCSAPIIVYFLAQGVFEDFVYWNFLHGMEYAGGSPAGDVLDTLLSRVSDMVKGDFLVLGAGVIAAAWDLTEKRSQAWFTLGFLAFSFLGAVPGFGFPHYFAQLAPAVAVAGGYGVATLLASLRQSRWSIPAAVVSGLLIVFVPIVRNSRYFLEPDPRAISRAYFGYNPFPESRKLADYLASQTAPSDGIFIMGSEPQILFYAERRSPSAFVMLYPLTSSYRRYMEFQDRAWNEIQQSPPRFILTMANIPASILWDGIADLRLVRRVEELIQREYALDRVMRVGGAQGEWIGADESRLDPGAPVIRVFRRTN
jgi:hypothetical protein